MKHSHAQAIILMVMAATLRAILRNAVTAWWMSARCVMTAIRLMVITATLRAVLRNAVTAWWILARPVMTATTTLAMAARHAQSMCAETD